MKHLRRAALCLTVFAMLTLGAGGVADAFSPEWGTCSPTGSGGHYVDAGCTQKAHKRRGEYTGGYEWKRLEGFDQSEEGALEMSGVFKLETAAGKSIECGRLRHSSVTELIGPNRAGTPRWQFAECSSEGSECATQFEEEGEIDTIFEREAEEEGKGWKPQLHIVSGGNTPNPVVGMSYTPVERERLFTPIVCEGPTGTVWIGGAQRGPNAVVSVIEPVNEMSSAYAETFSQSSPGHQSPERYADGHKTGLEAFINNHWEAVSMTADLSYTLEAPVELKATN